MAGGRSDTGGAAGAEAEGKDLLRFVACGSVDDGKSTLIGRLLHDSGLVPDDRLAAVAADSRRLGGRRGGLDLSLLLDGLQAEREQRITIDVAYRSFETGRRRFIVADAPGHEQYTRNMATGASTSEAAVVLVDARRGVTVQTRRHTCIASLLGIRRVILAVNKMDLAGWDRERFEATADAYRDFARRLGIAHVDGIPISALTGANVLAPSGETPWYRGPALLETGGDRGLVRPRRGRLPPAGPVGQPSRCGLPRVRGDHRVGDGSAGRPAAGLPFGPGVRRRADRDP